MSVRDRVKEHRARMRARGLRPVQIWVPDVRSPDFDAEVRRQCERAVAADAAGDDQDFIEAVSAEWDE